VTLTPENDSNEHLVLNALGGRRAVKGFICDPCNNTSGHTWDAVLAKQLNAFSLFFHITRQDGKPPAQILPTVSGRSIRVTYDGLEIPKPRVKVTPSGAGLSIQVTARTTGEARKIVTDLKRKYPSIDIEKALASATSAHSYLDEPIRMSVAIGGPDAGRSIVKSALGLAVASGVVASDCDDAQRYLATGKDACFGYINEVDLLKGRPKNTVVHCVAVDTMDDGLLLGYVELFSTFRMVVCLASSYRGKPVRAAYAIDPVTGTELDVSVRLPFTREDLTDIYEYRRISDGAVAQALGEIIPDAIRREFEREKKAVIGRAVNDAWRKLDLAPGIMLAAEHTARLTNLIMSEMQPFLLRHIQRDSIALPPVNLGASPHRG
jgi:hypothetical protein